MDVGVVPKHQFYELKEMDDPIVVGTARYPEKCQGKVLRPIGPLEVQQSTTQVESFLL